MLRLIERWRGGDPGYRRAVNRQHTAVEKSYSIGLKRALRQINRAFQQGDVERIGAGLEQIRRLHASRDKFQEVANHCLTGYLLPPGAGPQEGRAAQTQHQQVGDIAIYCASSLFLHECHQHLTRKLEGNAGPEWMLAVTGLRLGQFLTLEHRLDFTLSAHSTAHAAANMQEFTHLMVGLDAVGQCLHGIFHSHRFNGPPSPSGTDSRLQETLEQASYPAVQAIFSEDGYVRFFTCNRPFEVQVYGKEVQKHGRFLYHLNHSGKISHSRDHPSSPG